MKLNLLYLTFNEDNGCFLMSKGLFDSGIKRAKIIYTHFRYIQKTQLVDVETKSYQQNAKKVFNIKSTLFRTF